MSLKKIAEMTGVSVSTVSRVLNNKSFNCASEAVKEKIWAAAREINYVPNETARNLKLGAAVPAKAPVRSLAVILGRFDSLKKDPFFDELYRTVEEEVFAKGSVISSFLTAGECTGSTLPKADGFLILGRCPEALLGRIRRITGNIVAIDRNPTDFEIDEVICSGRKAAGLAMDYLIKKGHRKIGYIGDCSYETRYVGYCDSLIKNNLPMDYSLIFPTDQTEVSGYPAMQKLLAGHSCTAVLCANDATALGAARALREAAGRAGRKKSPDTVDLISIDNIQAAGEVSPLLTTVNIPQKEMGRMAVKLLLDRIAHGHTEMVRAEFPPRLVKRESC